MPVLKPDQPLITDKPVITVENKLPPGFYRFQLVVIDDEGNKSAPAIHTVKVVRRPALPPTVGRAGQEHDGEYKPMKTREKSKRDGK